MTIAGMMPRMPPPSMDRTRLVDLRGLVIKLQLLHLGSSFF